MTRLPLHLGVLAVAGGGAVGAVLRWLLTEEWSTSGSAFPWTVFGINVAGSALLATLPAFGVVRRSSWLPLFLGTGVLGGFTTMSTASEQTADLLDAGHPTTALLYAAGTLLAAVAAAALVTRLVSPPDRWAFDDAEGDQ